MRLELRHWAEGLGHCTQSGQCISPIVASTQASSYIIGYISDSQLYSRGCEHRMPLDVWYLVPLGKKIVYWTDQTNRSGATGYNIDEPGALEQAEAECRVPPTYEEA
jgi:hypothetical protein